MITGLVLRTINGLKPRWFYLNSGYQKVNPCLTSSRASPPRPQVSFISEARGLPCSTGYSPVTKAGSFCCGSRIRTANATLQKRSRRFMTGCAGWALIGTKNRSASLVVWIATRRLLMRCWHRARPTSVIRPKKK